MDIFAKATKAKLRFAFRGSITSEDLWSLNLNDLDSIYAGLMNEKKNKSQETLLVKSSKDDARLDLKIDIIKFIVMVKLKEQEKRINSQNKKVEREKLSRILSTKQDEALSKKSIDDIMMELKALDEKEDDEDEFEM
jgi:hypothetical protein